jgi:DNA polymerase-3 subunit chi
MLKIDFYVMNDDPGTSRLQVACKLIEKAYAQKHQIYIHTDNELGANEMDELLWTYRDDSFLPHHITGDGPEPAPPIQIGFSEPAAKHRDIMLNLSAGVPVFHTQFQRILEIVPADSLLQEQARERYRFYRQLNLPIQTHKLQAVEF